MPACQATEQKPWLTIICLLSGLALGGVQEHQRCGIIGFAGKVVSNKTPTSRHIGWLVYNFTAERGIKMFLQSYPTSSSILHHRCHSRLLPTVPCHLPQVIKLSHKSPATLASCPRNKLRLRARPSKKVLGFLEATCSSIVDSTVTTNNTSPNMFPLSSTLATPTTSTDRFSIGQLDRIVVASLGVLVYPQLCRRRRKKPMSVLVSKTQHKPPLRNQKNTASSSP